MSKKGLPEFLQRNVLATLATVEDIGAPQMEFARSEVWLLLGGPGEIRRAHSGGVLSSVDELRWVDEASALKNVRSLKKNRNYKKVKLNLQQRLPWE